MSKASHHLGRSPRAGADRWPIIARNVGLLAIPALALILALLLPGALVLPAIALLTVAVGFTLEALRQMREDGAVSRSASVREFAAGLVFLGFAAAILSDADQMAMTLLERPLSQSADASSALP